MSVSNRKLDRLAIFLSGLCLVHCLAIPIALVLGAVVTDWLHSNETLVHWILFGLAAPVSLWALGRNVAVGGRSNLYIGIVGLTFMFLGVSHLLGEMLEVALTVLGVTLVLVAHLRNLRVAHTH